MAEKESDIERIAKLEQELLNYQGKDRIVNSWDIRDKLKADTTPYVRYLSKIPKLDVITEGVAPGEVIITSGFPKCGKTSILQTLTLNYAEQQLSTLWFTYEVPVRQFFKKFPGGIDVPLFFLPNALTDSSLDWIERRIIEAKLKNDIKIVFIDHLHYLVPMNAPNLSHLIGAVVREIKKMALRHNVVIFLVAHTSKPKWSKDKNEKPGADAPRDSGMILAECDFLWMMSRPWYDEDDPEINTDKSSTLQVLANRWNGIRGSVPLWYDNLTFKEQVSHS